MPDDSSTAAQLMQDFAARTGILSSIERPHRYLWTDAFAVCNFLELFARTGAQEYRQYATLLIEQVHRVLGRYRDDDYRSGWISGLGEEGGRMHPTAGGLRIGKPLREREAAEPIDERQEWDRDGQYFHYLTKWMHALCQAVAFEENVDRARWAHELAVTAFRRFSATSGRRVVGVYWKMSTDLSRPLVVAVGSHDTLDGYLTFREVRKAMTRTKAAGEADLAGAIDTLSLLCQNRNWATDDPLGLGGLLFDACRLCRLLDPGRQADVDLLQGLLDGCNRGLRDFLRAGHLAKPPSYRLAFRELGLAIGLKALPGIAAAVERGTSLRTGLAARTIDALLQYESLAAGIIDDWLPPERRQDESQQVHRDINEVMLATALIPDTFLWIGKN